MAHLEVRLLFTCFMPRRPNYPTPESEPRFSQRAFRIFEPFALAAINSFPIPYKIDPASVNLSSTTFECRFRDALRTYCNPRCSWTSSLDRSRLSSIFMFLGSTDPGAYHVFSVNGFIHFSRRTASLPETQLLSLTPSLPSDSIIETRHCPEVLTAFCILISHNYLSTPIQLRASQDEIVQAENLYPTIAFLSEGDCLYTLM